MVSTKDFLWSIRQALEPTVYSLIEYDGVRRPLVVPPPLSLATMRSRAKTLLDKSTAALLSAIEIYNKPDFAYRVENFTILAVNAWELLLKARILQLDGNRLDSIIEFERRTRADGTLSTRLYRRVNRSGNPVTIGLFKAFDNLVNDYGDKLDPLIRKNLEALIEVRDNAIHFVNRDLMLEKSVQEIGTATLKNYVNAVRQWFGLDMSQYNFFLMPLAFFRDFRSAQGIALNGQERKLLAYLTAKQQEVENDDETNDFNLSLEIDVKFRRSGTLAGPGVRITTDPSAVAVRLREEDIRERYPWTYKILATRLRTRYVDFKENGTFHAIRRPLEENPAYCKTRLLDPGNPRSSRKRFYSPNIVAKFDPHYTRSAS